MTKLDLLYELYNVHSPSHEEDRMIEFLKNKLESMGLNPKIDQWGNIYVTKGVSNTYPCIVSHTDEVFTKRSKEFEVIPIKNEIIIGYDNVTKNYHGLGADDKNGIWCCLRALEEFDVLKAAFFVSEEVGGIGSSNCNIGFFNDCRFVLQCDRRGNSDLITSVYSTRLCSRKFISDVKAKNYGYKETSGMFTDVYNLKTRGLNVSVCNISCGYYNPHTETEYTKIQDLHKCYNFVAHIIRDCTDVYQHNYEKISSYTKYGNNYYGYFNHGISSFDDLSDWYDEEEESRITSKKWYKDKNHY